MENTNHTLTSQKRAQEIMGHNYFGVAEAIRHFGVNPSRQQLAALAEVPFTEATLEECKNTHVLAAVFPLSILEIRGKVLGNQRLFYNQDWYNRESFAKDRREAEWRLVRKTSVPNSTGNTWNEQRALLAKNEETPTARVMVYTIIGHFLVTGERLFEHIYVRCSDIVRCSDVGLSGYRVLVGDFGSDDLVIYDYWDDNCRDNIGVASTRKFD